MIFGLPYRQIVFWDFEFRTARSTDRADPIIAGDLPVPVCMVALEWPSGKYTKLWLDEMDRPCPFDTGPDTLFVAYYISAEIGCHLALEWPVPERLLDMFTEYRALTNGLALPTGGRGLLGALDYHGIPGITKEEKAAGRDLVMRGGPWTPAEREATLDYCQSDVAPLPALMERSLPHILSTSRGLGQALLRGRYMAATARIERTGIPIDVPALEAMRSVWPLIKNELIEEVDQIYHVYDGAVFKAGRFRDYLSRQGIKNWPTTTSGQLALDQKTFRDMSKSYPQLIPLYELRHAISDLRLEKLEVGEDGRNRFLQSAFGTITGRNAPGTNRNVFGTSSWLRSLVKPEPGRSLVYLDWKCQEVVIAAVLSGDAALLEDATQGDPYIRFAIRAGLAPEGATKESHPSIRQACKQATLGVSYGMGAVTLGTRLGISTVAAGQILRARELIYPDFYRWIRLVVASGQFTRVMRSRLGWPLRITSTTRSTTMQNYLMQVNGSEMLRLAACLASEAGVAVCALVHDAILVEAPTDDLEAVVAVARAAMTEASAVVLGGQEIEVDVKAISWPERYADERGAAMWHQVQDAVTRHQGEVT